jgi:uncharacterized RmlC-like cupin family protein
MDNKEYADLVNSGNYPDNIKVPLDKPFVDDRGVIQNIWLATSGSITFISSKKGAKRAAHIHTGGDWHSTFMISGEVLYVEGEGAEQTKTKFGEGDMFYTRPEVYHEMIFLEDSKMITVNGIVKNHENYENSVRRKKI